MPDIRRFVRRASALLDELEEEVIFAELEKSGELEEFLNWVREHGFDVTKRFADDDSNK